MPSCGIGAVGPSICHITGRLKAHGAPPLAWTIIFGLVCRCCLSTLHVPEHPGTQRMQVYVDDPLIAVAGNPRARDYHLRRALLILAVTGFPLA